MITYSFSELNNINNHYHTNSLLPLHTFKHICSLSINKVKRTHRSFSLANSLRSLFKEKPQRSSNPNLSNEFSPLLIPHSPAVVPNNEPISHSSSHLTSASSFLSGFLLNIRSINHPKKYNFIYDTINTESPSFFAITESWLSSSNVTVSSLATPINYSFLHNSRESRRGGGVALICSNQLYPKKLSLNEFTSFESISIKIKLSKPIILSIIYRPPSSSLSVFLDHFTDYLSLLANFNLPLLIVGDFNIHVNSVSD